MRFMLFRPGHLDLPVTVTVVLCLVIFCVSSIYSRDLTLEQAVDMALHHTARGEMIKGNLDVARQYYSARRINLYLPEISINGTLPTYAINEFYRPFSNSFDKHVFETKNLDFQSFIELKQTLLTGGTLTATANLASEDSRYPDVRYDAGSGIFVNEDSRRGFFNFSLEQPLFRPSSARNELDNRRDDLEIARMTKIEEEASLEKEVTEAYLEVLLLSLKNDITADKLENARLQEQIDSAKLTDGVVSEEDHLLSASSRLDAELEHFEIETQYGEQRRELATILDFDVSETLELSEPAVTAHINDAVRQRMIDGWGSTAPITKAEHVYLKSKRQANYAASGHGLTGDLRATYSLGKQKIETERHSEVDNGSTTIEEDINTSGWTVALEFRLPLWDGGAGSAAVKAAHYEAEQAKYEFTRAQRSAKAQIVNLINQLDVSYQRLDIIGKQIDLAANRLRIADSRFEDGQISQLTLLESKIFYLETKEKYLEELKTYLVNRIDLDSKFVS